MPHISPFGEATEADDILAGAFLTGVEIDVDQWRAQTIEELQTWLSDIKTRKTQLGDQLVDFPDDWDPEKVLSQKQQFDLISHGLAASLTGTEAKEAQAELQAIRAQAEKIRQLDKLLGQFGDDDEPFELNPAEDDLLNTEIVIPHIDTSGPNPCDILPELQARLKEIDEKLGIKPGDDNQKALRSLNEINDDLLKLYQDPSEESPKPTETAEPAKPAAMPRPEPANVAKPVPRK
jgi:vacuolar-type H+-ATPase subunit I/STV1